MTYTSIFEKILFILNIVSTSWIYIAFLCLTLLLIAMLSFKKISKKTCFLLVTTLTKLVLGYTIYIYYEPISKMINSLVDNIFLNIYFPSTYAYLFILLFINIIAIASLLKPRGEKIYKTVNGVCLIITNFTLALVLETIAKDNVDIFEKASLFANTKLITLLEFGVNIFITWIISLVTIYIINNITERIIIAKENKKFTNDPVTTLTTEIVINENKVQEEYQATNGTSIKPLENPVHAFIPNKEQYKFIPNFTIATSITEEPKENKFIPVIEKSEEVADHKYGYKFNDTGFDLSSFIPKKQEVKPINVVNEPINSNQIFEQILNNELPVIKEEPKVLTIEETKNSYTLNDYRIFNKMLKDIREHNQSNSITIDKNLEYRLITKYSTETYNMFKTMLKIYSN